MRTLFLLFILIHIVVLSSGQSASQVSDTGRQMKELELELPAQFSRVHLSYIVNMDRITKIQDNHILIGRNRISISHSYRIAFFEAVNRRMI